MELETALSLAETQENGAKYDASVKAFFKHKEAVAPILARVVREYAGYTNEEIAEFRDTITRYCLKKEDLLGTVPVDRRFDLMEVVIIRRGGDNTSGDTLLDYLEGVFGNDRAKVEGYLGPVNETVMEDYTMLTGFAHSLEARAEARGEARGEAQTEAKIYNNIVARLREQHPDWSDQEITEEAKALIGVL